MKFKPWIASIVIAAALVYFGLGIGMVGVEVFAQDQPAAAPEAKADPKPEAKAEPAKDTKIGKELDQETIANLIQLIGEASKQKGSFWLNPSLWEIVFTIIMLILGFFAAKYKWDQKSWGSALKIVEQAVNEVYREFIREAKAKNADGKLSKEEINGALDLAWKKAVEIGKSQGVDLAKFVAKEYFPVVCDKIITAMKGKQ